MFKKLIVGIVTYNPQTEILKLNLEHITTQTDLIIIVDNNSSNIKEIKQLINDYNVKLIDNKENLGVAKALNQIIEFGSKYDREWALLLDQDSIVDSEYIDSMTDNFEGNIGVVCPRIFDEVTDKEDLQNEISERKWIEVCKCITSGSFVRINMWEKIGKFDEKLFIDGVDFEFCNRVLNEGFKILKNQKVILKHKIGEQKVVKLGLFSIKHSEHNAFRVYYICRNRIYCDYKKDCKIHFRSYMSILKVTLNIIVFEKDKRGKIASVVNGIRDAYALIRNSNEI